MWKVTQSPGLGVSGITSLQVNHLWLSSSLYILTLPGLSDPPNPVVLFFGYLLSALVWVRLPLCLLSIQVPAPSPGCSSSGELRACPSAPPTASFGLRSHLPAPSRKCGLSLPSWGPKPPAQVSRVLNVEGRHLPSLRTQPLVPGSSSLRQWLLAGTDTPGCCERTSANGQWDRGASLRPHSPVPASALRASCPCCGHQHSSLEV